MKREKRRDLFAIAAMQALLSSMRFPASGDEAIEELGKQAFLVADAMLRASDTLPRGANEQIDICRFCGKEGCVLYEFQHKLADSLKK